jgi:hypothetical protein
MLNRYPPPRRSSFAGLSEKGTEDALEVDIGGWSYRFVGLDGSLRASLQIRYGAFLLNAEDAGQFTIRILDGLAENFVPPGSSQRGQPHPLTLDWDGENLLARSYGFTGWLSLAEHEGAIALARGDYEKGPWSVENFLRVCTASRAAREGGALLHAASLMRSGGAFLFMGASGSGKSTLAATSAHGEVISDDLTLIRKLPEGYRVAGTPFRGTHTGGRPVRGFFPIVGMYRIFKAERNRLEECPQRNAVADLLACCPFVVDQLARYPEFLAHLRAIDSAHPLAYLHFNLQGDFWNVLSGVR